jgi:hypothetical protein
LLTNVPDGISGTISGLSSEVDSVGSFFVVSEEAVSGDEVLVDGFGLRLLLGEGLVVL